MARTDVELDGGCSEGVSSGAERLRLLAKEELMGERAAVLDG